MFYRKYPIYQSPSSCTPLWWAPQFSKDALLPFLFLCVPLYSAFWEVCHNHNQASLLRLFSLYLEPNMNCACRGFPTSFLLSSSSYTLPCDRRLPHFLPFSSVCSPSSVFCDENVSVVGRTNLTQCLNIALCRLHQFSCGAPAFFSYPHIQGTAPQVFLTRAAPKGWVGDQSWKSPYCGTTERGSPDAQSKSSYPPFKEHKQSNLFQVMSQWQA